MPIEDTSKNQDVSTILDMTSGNNLKRLLMGEEATGLLYISDRLLAGELSRVEGARGALCPLKILPEPRCLYYARHDTVRQPASVSNSTLEISANADIGIV